MPVATRERLTTEYGYSFIGVSDKACHADNTYLQLITRGPSVLPGLLLWSLLCHGPPLALVIVVPWPSSNRILLSHLSVQRTSGKSGRKAPLDDDDEERKFSSCKFRVRSRLDVLRFKNLVSSETINPIFL
jgi:hypothetical protein